MISPAPPFSTTSYDTLYWQREKFHCERNLDYLASKYLRIKSKSVIGFPTLRLNRPQRFLLNAMVDQHKRTGWIRQVWGKARQVGSSTLCRALSFQQTAFQDNRNALLTTHDEPTSYEMFDMEQTFYDALPPQLQPKLRYRAKARMLYEKRNSRSIAGHALNLNVGASQMHHVAHLSEVARYRNAEEVQGSLFPSISSAKGEDYSVVILESTSHYGGTWFKEFAEAARRGETDYEFHFVPWPMHDDYTSPVPPSFQPTFEEKALMREFNLTLGNLVWRRAELANYATQPYLFLSEYPLSWEQSWQLPKGALRTFPDAVLQPMAVVRPGRRARLTSTGVAYEVGGPFEVWEEPQDGVFYHAGLDLAEGRTEKADWTVLCIVRRDTLEEVASCRLHMDPASEEFEDLVYWAGHCYNTAQLVPDITAGWGNAILNGLQRRNYPNLWRWRRRDDAKERVSQRVGFLYTKRDKITLVNNSVQLATRGQARIHSEVLLDELRNFLALGLDEWGAAPGSYDDYVAAWQLALLGAADERESGVVLPPDTPAPHVDEPHRYHDIDADLLEARDAGAIDVAPWPV